MGNSVNNPVKNLHLAQKFIQILAAVFILSFNHLKKSVTVYLLFTELSNDLFTVIQAILDYLHFHGLVPLLTC